jgi:hypothetical protein
MALLGSPSHDHIKNTGPPVAPDNTAGSVSIPQISLPDPHRSGRGQVSHPPTYSPRPRLTHYFLYVNSTSVKDAIFDSIWS